jgi:magnesium transporter
VRHGEASDLHPVRERLEQRPELLRCGTGAVLHAIVDKVVDDYHYFRDVNDHLIRVHEQLDSFRDLLTSILEANLSQVTVRQNEDVRKISAIVAILAVPTMIAGIYGMNFEHMPELGWTFGYPLALGLMAAICTLVYRYFKRIGWL